MGYVNHSVNSMVDHLKDGVGAIKGFAGAYEFHINNIKIQDIPDDERNRVFARLDEEKKALESANTVEAKTARDTSIAELTTALSKVVS